MSQIRSADIPEQTTLVALYGAKPPAIAALIRELQDIIASELGSGFEPYASEQVHATLIGLESARDDPRVNRNRFERDGTAEPMDLAGYLRWLREGDALPFAVQLGGFADRDYPFESQGKRPYLRSFSLQGEFAVLMGWPVEMAARPEGGNPNDVAGEFPRCLERIRRAGEAYGIVHRYHIDPSGFDDDFYLRLGTLVPDRVDDGSRQQIEANLREQLAARPALRIRVGPEDLSLVAYRDRQLPWPGSRRKRLSEVDLDRGADREAPRPSS